jgi:hypothetical protein
MIIITQIHEMIYYYTQISRIRSMEKLCQICNKNKIEIYQLELEVCFDCWMDKTTPEIY